jgi:hypothetical protein
MASGKSVRQQTFKTHEELHRAMMAGHLMADALLPLIDAFGTKPAGVSEDDRAVLDDVFLE